MSLDFPWPEALRHPIRVWEYQGVLCAIVYGYEDVINGYVHVPPAHPWADLYITDIDVDVHGGLTYGPYYWPECEFVFGDEKVTFPAGGRTRAECAGWIGFDTAHSDDFDDMFLTTWNKSEEYVIEEVENLADQLKEASNDLVV